MAFKYALVARGTIPLAEYGTIKGNIRTLAMRVLENIDPKRQIMLIEQDTFVFQALMNSIDNIIYLCFTDKSVSGYQRNAFLNELQMRWNLKYGNSSSKLKAYAKSDEFQQDFKSLFNAYNNEGYIVIQEIPENTYNDENQQALEPEAIIMKQKSYGKWIIVTVILVVSIAIVITLYFI